MSRLLERLERARSSPSAPMGFGAGGRASRPPPIVVVAACTSPQQGSEVAGTGVDGAFLFLQGMNRGWVEAFASSLKDLPWGVALPAPSPETVATLREMGCDFLVFGGETPLEALQESEMGRVLRAPLDLPEEVARTLEDLPVDAVLVDSPYTPPFALHQAMDLGAFRGRVGRPLLLFLSAVPSAFELQCLRDMGIEGVFLDVGQTGPQALSALRERVEGLPRSPRRRERVTPLLPSSFPSPRPSEQEEPEEPDEEF